MLTGKRGWCPTWLGFQSRHRPQGTRAFSSQPVPGPTPPWAALGKSGLPLWQVSRPAQGGAAGQKGSPLGPSCALCWALHTRPTHCLQELDLAHPMRTLGALGPPAPGTASREAGLVKHRAPPQEAQHPTAAPSPGIRHQRPCRPPAHLPVWHSRSCTSSSLLSSRFPQPWPPQGLTNMASLPTQLPPGILPSPNPFHQVIPLMTCLTPEGDLGLCGSLHLHSDKHLLPHQGQPSMCKSVHPMPSWGSRTQKTRPRMGWPCAQGTRQSDIHSPEATTKAWAWVLEGRARPGKCFSPGPCSRSACRSLHTQALPATSTTSVCSEKGPPALSPGRVPPHCCLLRDTRPPMAVTQGVKGCC